MSKEIKIAFMSQNSQIIGHKSQTFLCPTDALWERQTVKKKEYEKKSTVPASENSHLKNREVVLSIFAKSQLYRRPGPFDKMWFGYLEIYRLG